MRQRDPARCLDSVSLVMQMLWAAIPAAVPPQLDTRASSNLAPHPACYGDLLNAVSHKK